MTKDHDQLPIVLTNLTKYYGTRKGVEDINLAVHPGEVFGFLGANGAGKSTTIRTILNFISPTSGSARVFGLDSVKDSVAIKHRVGYLSGNAELYNDMTGQQLFQYLASFGNLVDWDYVQQLVTRLQAEPERQINKLSKGNRQKIALIQALMHQPDLLILDEPTNGLDPLMQQVFYQLIEEAKAKEKTVFLSSHNLTEVQKICDRAAFVRNGNLVAIEELSNTQNLTYHRYIVEFAQPPQKEVFAQLPNTNDLSIDGTTMHIGVSGSVDQFIKTLAVFKVVALDEQETSLEDVFLHYYENEPDA